MYATGYYATGYYATDYYLAGETVQVAQPPQAFHAGGGGAWEGEYWRDKQAPPPVTESLDERILREDNDIVALIVSIVTRGLL